jgi:hypothetical protein
MESYEHVYLSEAFLDWEMFQTKVAVKIRPHVLYSVTSPLPPQKKINRVWHNGEEYGRARQATGDNIKRSMRFACSIPRARDTHSKYFPTSSGYANAPRCYILRTLPLLLCLLSSFEHASAVHAFGARFETAVDTN